MKELRLEYQKETGVNIDKRINTNYYGEERELRVDIEEYIEWLEEKLLDDTALFNLMNKILHEKNKETSD
jgi:hypothetical protein